MKWTIISCVALLILLVILSALKGLDTLELGFKKSFTTGAQFLPLLIIIFLMMGFIEVLLPEGFVRDWLSDSSGYKGILIAWVAGILTPAGTVMGFPIAAGLAKAGVGVGVLVTYLTSLALLSIMRLPLEIGFLGIQLFSIRFGISLFVPPLAGIMTQMIYTSISKLK